MSCGFFFVCLEYGGVEGEALHTRPIKALEQVPYIEFKIILSWTKVSIWNYRIKEKRVL